MQTYKKLLVFLQKQKVLTNKHISNKQNSNSNYYYSNFRSHQYFFNPQLFISNFFKVLRLIQYLNKKQGVVFFVGNSKEFIIASRIINFSKNQKNFRIISKWSNGLLTNSLFFSNKPDLVVFFEAEQNFVGLKECYMQNVPTVGFVTNLDVVKNNLISYKIFLNSNNVKARWFLIQLFLSQIIVKLK